MAAAATGKGKRNSNEKDKRGEILVSKTVKSRNQTKNEPAPSFPFQKVWARAVIIICAAVVVYYSARNKEVVFASQKHFIEKRSQSIPCSNSYKSEVSQFKACIPRQCGRLISDSLVSAKEAEVLRQLAENGLALGGSDGGASILDLHSGALSHGQNFINLYKIPESLSVFKSEDFMTYNFTPSRQRFVRTRRFANVTAAGIIAASTLKPVVKNKIHHAVSRHFGVPSESLYLTQPTFFSRLTNVPPVTIHDEYWHTHVDKETYSAFHYTSLVYLNDYGRDFFGGRFVFVDPKNKTNVIEPKKGRVSAFTSGAENPHYVERVTSGTRYAITISFTCDPSQEISDPQLHVDRTKLHSDD